MLIANKPVGASDTSPVGNGEWTAGGQWGFEKVASKVRSGISLTLVWYGLKETLFFVLYIMSCISPKSVENLGWYGHPWSSIHMKHSEVVLSGRFLWRSSSPRRTWRRPSGLGAGHFLSAMSSKKKGLVKKEHPKLKYSDPLLVCIFGGFLFCRTGRIWIFL